MTSDKNINLYDNIPKQYAAAAAAAKSLQSCPTLCDPIDSSPSGSPVPGILLTYKMIICIIGLISIMAVSIFYMLSLFFVSIFVPNASSSLCGFNLASYIISFSSFSQYINCTSFFTSFCGCPSLQHIITANSKETLSVIILKICLLLIGG